MPFNNLARAANDDRMAGDVLIDKRGVNAQIDTVTYRGNALSFSAVFLADGAPLVNIDVAPQLSIHVDRDSIGMADIEPLANLG